jgi:hypothetical protein
VFQPFTLHQYKYTFFVDIFYCIKTILFVIDPYAWVEVPEEELIDG